MVNGRMNFLDLPLEIQIIIIEYLDTPSLYSMYNTCKHTRNVVTMGMVKKGCFSKNTLASVYYFETEFFADMAHKLHELNLCGAPDVRKTLLLRGIRKLKNLHTLDISYTDLSLIDFVAIYKVCPTIVDITLNFMIKKSGIAKLNDEAIIVLQKAFKNCKNIHFVGSATNLLYGKLSMLLLHGANIETLKFSVSESDRLHTVYVPENAGCARMPTFKLFSLYFLDWTTVYAFFGSFFMLPVLSMINLQKVEVLVIIRKNLKNCSVHSTPIFNKYILDTFNVETEKVIVSEYSDAIMGNAAIMVWDKNSNSFDEEFFSQLTKKLKPYFPWDCTESIETTVPDSHDWYYLTPTVPDGKLEIPWPKGKKRKAPAEVALNYDKLFESKDSLKLSLLFDEFIINPITLPVECNYLGKLSYLSLTGSVRLTGDFFKILFINCVNLVTLNVEAPAISPCYQPISQFIHYNKTLKNLRLCDRAIDFKMMFDALTKCVTLENLYISEMSSADDTNIANPEIIILHCPNLYNLFIKGRMTEASCNRKEKFLNNFKESLNKYHLNVTLFMKGEIDRKFYCYDEYISVFNLNPIKTY